MITVTIWIISMSKGVEPKSYPIIKHSIDRLGGFYYKPADVGFGGAEKNRFTQKRPCDIIGVTKDYTWIVEMKGYRDYCGLSITHLRPSQIETLEALLKAKNKKTLSLVGYIFYKPRIMKKIVFVYYEDLKRVKLIKKNIVVDFLKDEKHGEVFGENIIDPETQIKTRKYFIDLENLDNYIIKC